MIEKLLTLNAIGLAYDIVGVLILGLTLALTRSVTLFDQSGTYWDANPNLFYALILQRHDARVGLAFLIFGFSAQFLTAIGIIVNREVAIALYAVIPILLGVYLVRRRFVNQSAGEKFKMLDEAERD